MALTRETATTSVVANSPCGRAVKVQITRLATTRQASVCLGRATSTRAKEVEEVLLKEAAAVRGIAS